LRDLKTEWQQKMNVINNVLSYQNYCIASLLNKAIIVVKDDVGDEKIPLCIRRNLVVYSYSEIKHLKELVDAGKIDEKDLRFIHECKKAIM